MDIIYGLKILLCFIVSSLLSGIGLIFLNKLNYGILFEVLSIVFITFTMLSIITLTALSGVFILDS